MNRALVLSLLLAFDFMASASGLEPLSITSQFQQYEDDVFRCAGDVVVTLPGYVLQAETIACDTSRRILMAKGGNKAPVLIQGKEGAVLADSCVVRYAEKKGKASRLRATFGARYAQAQEARFDGDTVLLSDVAYSACGHQVPHWSLSAPSAWVRGGRLYTGGARFKVGGLSCPSLPLLSYPLLHKAASGLLFPSLSYEKQSGLMYGHEAYFSVSEKSDCTVGVSTASRRGAFAHLQVRHMNEPSFFTGDVRLGRDTHVRSGLSSWSSFSGKSSLSDSVVLRAQGDLGTDRRVMSKPFFRPSEWSDVSSGYAAGELTGNGWASVGGVSWKRVCREPFESGVLGDSYEVLRFPEFTLRSAQRVPTRYPVRWVGVLHGDCVIQREGATQYRSDGAFLVQDSSSNVRCAAARLGYDGCLVGSVPVLRGSVRGHLGGRVRVRGGLKGMASGCAASPYARFHSYFPLLQRSRYTCGLYTQFEHDGVLFEEGVDAYSRRYEGNYGVMEARCRVRIGGRSAVSLGLAVPVQWAKSGKANPYKIVDPERVLQPIQASFSLRLPTSYLRVSSHVTPHSRRCVRLECEAGWESSLVKGKVSCLYHARGFRPVQMWDGGWFVSHDLTWYPAASFSLSYKGEWSNDISYFRPVRHECAVTYKGHCWSLRAFYASECSRYAAKESRTHSVGLTFSFTSLGKFATQLRQVL